MARLVSAQKTLGLIAGSPATGSVTPEMLAATARAQMSVFDETFESGIASESNYSWTIYGGVPKGNLTYPLNGIKGGTVLNIAKVSWQTYSGYLPYDPTQTLYRMTVRIRRTATSDAANQYFYCGVLTAAADKSLNIGGGTNTWVVANGVNASAWTINVWQTLQGWFKSTGAAAGSGTATDPYKLPANTAYMLPSFVVNYSSGGVGNVIEIDEITIEGFDPDGQNRLYLSLASNGEINANKVIETSITNNAVTTNKIYAASVVAGKISVTYLSDIVGDFGTITAGTVTGALIRTAASGKRVEMRENGDFSLEAYDGSANYVITVDTTHNKVWIYQLQMGSGGIDAGRVETGSGGNMGTGLMALKDRGFDPSTPSAAGDLYCKSGALYFIGSSGTVTPLAPA